MEHQPRIRLGMVGGGADAFIGAVHRIAARIDDRYDLVAGALSSTPERALASGRRIGLAPDRIYADYAEMARVEAAREDGIEAVAVVTPNHLHFAVAKAFLEQGIHVICDKPMTSTLEDAETLRGLVESSGVRLMLTHNYSAYPMVREARRLVAEGALGEIRVVNVEYAQDWLAGAAESKQSKWRLDPEQAGRGGAIADIGTHALHLASFVSGLEPTSLSADLHSFGAGRRVDDNAHIMLRYPNGARGLLWVSQVAVGNENALRLRVYGTRGSIEFDQEAPNRIWFTPIGEPRRLLTRGGAGFAGAARIPAGHPEGFLEAFASLYAEFADDLRSPDAPRAPIPGVRDGVAGLRFIQAALDSSGRDGAWVALDPA
ncbi:Gfo/Idh/MocA family protein [Limimaricola pyoseonensis]|uniref:Predicted dehydrogenase n=1 Tax=Limimaricola pyoseonensis TaxID=521013 RepID=A0A1G7CEP0_9RHOB|nr:Gfo/Idh/MocA family oxidoreductase [Limimaricola pyoseonensis]SDE37166.1 Predicted dehydrogenase [Limimaricola pyoseonensis]